MDATQYLEHWKRRKVWTHLKYPKHQQRLKRCAELVEGEKFLDVGCAFGHSTEIMAGFRAGEWAGLDFCEEAITKAAELFPNRTWWFVKNLAENLPPSLIVYKYDSIVCSEVIEHVAEDREFVRSVIGLAKRRAVFTTPDRRVADPGHLRIHTRESLETLFSGYDFEILHEPPFFYIVARLNHA